MRMTKIMIPATAAAISSAATITAATITTTTTSTAAIVYPRKSILRRKEEEEASLLLLQPLIQPHYEEVVGEEHEHNNSIEGAAESEEADVVVLLLFKRAVEAYAELASTLLSVQGGVQKSIDVGVFLLAGSAAAANANAVVAAAAQGRTTTTTAAAQEEEEKEEEKLTTATTTAPNPAAEVHPSFTEMTAGYLRMLALRANSPYVYHHPHDDDAASDPVYWAYEMVNQCLHVRAKKEGMQLKAERIILQKKKNTAAKEEGSFDEDGLLLSLLLPQKRKMMMATKSVSFDLFEHSRKFTETDDDDSQQQHDATATPARDYDGPSPLSLELDRLLVDRTRNPPRIKPAPFSLPAMMMPGQVPASLLISTLRAMLVSSRPVVLYPSQLRIGKSHHYMLKTTAEAIEKKFYCSADV